MTERVEMRGTKSVYDCATDKWNSEPVRLLVETEPFQEGGMRIAYKAQELFADGSAMDAASAGVQKLMLPVGGQRRAADSASVGVHRP